MRETSGSGQACWHIQITGMVQGVGFRPYLYRLAQDYGLLGWVLNDGEGVELEVQGPRAALAGFLEALPREKPPLAQIHGLTKQERPPGTFTRFEIRASVLHSRPQVLIPPDLAICPQCREEVLAAGERYHHYPFTNCTYCGPRFTVVKGLPYDRVRTSMAAFEMCPECAADYRNPLHRRFHAQPTACSRCGPQVTLLDREGVPLSGHWEERFSVLLRAGKIFAVKGIGGFHLVCSALNQEAVQRLRQAKKRPFRPLAVMAKDVATVKKYCRVSPLERETLLGPAAPIVILETKPGAVPENLAPRQKTLGVMLPYSPLHILLFTAETDLLVMTSGNARGLPIVKDNEEALRDLSPFADYFLVHNREIVNRCDDSVVRVIQGGVHFYRRSRGYVPAPVALTLDTEADVLGCGGEMKNTFCLIQGRNAFLSQHLGDMTYLEGLENYRRALRHLQGLLQIAPRIIGYDLHPQYSVTPLVRGLFEGPDETEGEAEGNKNVKREGGIQRSGGIKKEGGIKGSGGIKRNEQVPVRFFAVQHHHAHLASAMADNALEGEVIGAILDGTGYGTDGTLWGFEILSGGYRSFTRQVHLAPVPLPGGERAVLNPWLTATAYLLTYLGEEGKSLAERCFPGREKDVAQVARMLEHEVNAPGASGAGRLFDAAAALLGICLTSTYDGQAAMELGELARVSLSAGGFSSAAALGPGEPASDRVDDTWQEYRVGQCVSGESASYPFGLRDGILEADGLLRGILRDRQAGFAVRKIAVKFHRSVAQMVLAGVKEAFRHTGLRRVVLSGGVWQNPLLLDLALELLSANGFTVYTHRSVPANDGGLSLGQAVAAYHMWLSEQS
ncbi:acylphosphatase [Acididesulfobacillus acetoxydans]|uniref:Carbamoyltransferase n=1 Tax=Acididesulfobacillus acetoxydans TaxID=1561005 RepID=A0A8S0W3G1_9FIRM|nr:carbamoyltransferase HypF [Acididesulfobacillus acetoxydans]CAA7601648.1 acylphosphatase [Acididesulfobacillus acetoxydans]CEJ07135.1 X [Acididesulfobacillus acetoxydans] [Acididesulfobacillus acetoxydans]